MRFHFTLEIMNSVDLIESVETFICLKAETLLILVSYLLWCYLDTNDFIALVAQCKFHIA